MHCIIITKTLNELLVNLDTWIQENMKISVDVNYKQFISVKPVLLTNCGICFTMYISLIIWFISLLHCLTKHPVSLNKIYLPMLVFSVFFLAGKSKSAVQGAEGGYGGFDVEAGEKMNASQVKVDWMCMVLCSFYLFYMTSSQ